MIELVSLTLIFVSLTIALLSVIVLFFKSDRFKKKQLEWRLAREAQEIADLRRQEEVARTRVENMSDEDKAHAIKIADRRTREKVKTFEQTKKEKSVIHEEELRKLRDKRLKLLENAGGTSPQEFEKSIAILDKRIGVIEKIVQDLENWNP